MYEDCFFSLFTTVSKGVTFSNNIAASGLSSELTEKVLKNEEKELEWFSGFSEAESWFNISKKGDLKFKIKLHSDDRQTLVYIQKLLTRLAKGRKIGVITDSKNFHESYYSVNRFKDIIHIINPIFSKYYFTTSKYLDFMDLKKASNIKLISYLAKRKLNNKELEEILKLKSKMNTNRICFNPNSLPKRLLTSYRLLGFIEGDGSFCLPNLIPTLTIKQHTKNIHFFYEISEFFNNLPFNPKIGPATDILNNKPKPGIYNAASNSQVYSMSSLQVTNILQLYNYILPFFKSLEFKSRKSIDFYYWEAAINLKALGYTTLPKGREYLLDINKYINKRYSSNIHIAKAPNMEEIEKLLNTPPIFDLSSGLTYKNLSDLVKTKNKGSIGYGVNVYDKGELLKGSPFPSYTKAALALGNINISSVISKKIDSNKLYKNRYKFESDITNCN